MNLRIALLSLFILPLFFLSPFAPNIHADSGSRASPRYHREYQGFEFASAITLDCLTDLDSISEIDKLTALVAQLKNAKKPARQKIVTRIVKDIKARLDGFTTLLSGRAPQLNLTSDLASFSALLANVKKGVKKSLKVKAKNFKKNRINALSQLTALRALINPICDDGNFCNGGEVCSIVTATCQSGGDPCTAPLVCNEGSNACETQTGVTLNLTLNPDNLLGGELDDLFISNLEFNSGTATVLPTLQTGDVVNGGAGFDTLNAVLNFGAPSTLTPNLSSIDSVGITDLGTGATTLNCTTIQGTTIFNLFNGTNPNALAINNLGSLTNLRLASQATGAQISFLNSATTGTSDALTLTLSNLSAGTVTVSTAANGLETLNILSQGISNTLTQLVQNTGSTLSNVNISGGASFTATLLNPFPGTVRSVNASAATGPTTLSLAATFTDLTFTGGSGNDTLALGGAYSASDLIDGGGGINTLGVNATQAVQASQQSNVTNIQNLLITNTLLGESIILSRFGASDAILDSIGSTLLLNLPSSMTFPSGNRTIIFNNDDINDQFNMIASGVGLGDVLTISANNFDQSFAATQLATVGFETVNFISNNGLDGTLADANANSILNLFLTPTVGAGTLNFSGGTSVVVSQALKADIINASTLGAALIMETRTSTVISSGALVTGSPFGDELTGGAGVADQIFGGDGNDQIKGLDGADLTTGGNGFDRFFFDGASQFGDTLLDFIAGTDQVGLGSGLINFAGIAGVEDAPATLTTANFESGRIGISSLVAADTLKVVRISSSQTTSEISNNVGAAVSAYVLVFDSTLQRGVLMHDADWSSAAGRSRVALLENITSLSALQAISFTDFVEID